MACQHQQLRSTSLPLRPHALVQEIEDELRRIQSGAAASASASAPSPRSAASLAARLGDAYGLIEELVRLPGGGRDALSGARCRGAAEAALDASVALLDLCQRARDAASCARQHARAARRALRRGDAALAGAAARGYARCLAEAGRQHARARKSIISSTSGKRAAAGAEAAPAAVAVMSEAAAVTVAVLQRAVASLSARAVDARSRKSKWCVVSKLLRSDWSPLGGTSSSSLCEELNGDDETLLELEDSVEAVESALEHLFRRIVETRVALLNVLTL